MGPDNAKSFKFWVYLFREANNSPPRTSPEGSPAEIKKSNFDVIDITPIKQLYRLHDM